MCEGDQVILLVQSNIVRPHQLEFPEFLVELVLGTPTAAGFLFEHLFEL
jgi:hypothetical protein